MRLALTLYDERGALEVASVNCDNFAAGCYQLEGALSTALWHYKTAGLPSTTAGLSKEAADLVYALADMGGDYELLPVVSC